MLKIIQKITLIITILFFFGIGSTNAATYTNIATADHQVFVAPLITAVNNYLSTAGTITAADIPAIGSIVQNTILATGGWGGTMPSAYTANTLVQLNGNILTVGCGNEPMVSFNLPPVITHSTTTSNGGACSSYISSYSPVWSNCSISSNWTSNGTINCQQNTSSWTANTAACGVNITTTNNTLTDGVITSSTSSTNCDTSSCSADVPQPADQNITNKLTSSINNNSSTCNGIYANNNDTCRIKINITGTTKQGKSIIGLSGKNIRSILNKSYYPSNNVDGIYSINSSALNFNFVTSSPISGNGTNFIIDISGIKARTPINKNNGKISLDILGLNKFTNITFNNIKYYFQKPVKGEFKIYSSGAINLWSGEPQIGPSQNYKINLNNIGSLGNISNGNINILENNTIKTTILGHSFQNFNKGNNSFTSTPTSLYFDTRINATSSVLKSPIVTSNNLSISYILGGQLVKYYLDNFHITGKNATINNLGLKVVGTLQGGGKSSLTGQKANFSDISKSTARLGLKRNIYTSIRGMTSGTIVNGIKYIKGQDVTINSSSTNYETIVVEDGNLIIGGDITTTMGIFVLSNNLGDSSIGNVYVNQDVTQIDAIIYADGGFISSDTSGNPYIIDNNTRTSALQQQLILKGSLFTRNTIGGAVLGTSGKYILPGGNTTTNFNSAMKYDLNYIRRGNVGCLDVTGGINGGADGICDNYKDYFIIIYNPAIQTNPPKGF